MSMKIGIISFTEQVTRKMIRNPEGTSPPTIYVGKEEDYDMSKFVPADVTRGVCSLVFTTQYHVLRVMIS